MKIIKVWSILLLLPVIPVILLYWLFAELNYFELQNTVKGIVATGPIAAYVGIILIGSNIYRKMVATPDQGLEDLVGNWTIVSASGTGAKGIGTCYIQYDRGELTISGDFRSEDLKESGTWHCEMVKMRNNRLLMAYTLQTIRNGEKDTLDGITILSFGNQPVTKMKGIWAIAGREKMSGTVEYTRVQ